MNASNGQLGRLGLSRLVRHDGLPDVLPGRDALRDASIVLDLAGKVLNVVYMRMRCYG